MPPPSASLRAPAGLAAGHPAVVRSTMPNRRGQDTAAKLARAKERLYVICQMGGWSVFLLVQIAFLPFVDSKEAPRDKTTSAAIIVMVMLIGLLLTHYARPFMTRWGWKQLGWRTLVPRVIGLATVQSFLWTALGYGCVYGLLRCPWLSKYPPWLMMTFSFINGITLLIGWLCLYFFYHLFDRLNRSEIERLRLADSVKEAELRALKSQINPHFLFNSLNSLRALIDEDAPRARESVTRLANMLRYSLQSGQQETVPLEEELRIVEDYLALELIRHENRLRVRWDIAPGVRALPIPPMLLQTLVENAVKYGISPRRDGGELAISAHLDAPAAGQPAMLHFRVANPGELGAPLSASAALAGSSTGVGLRNASERLKLLYGDHAALCLLAEPPGCVTADVRIPLS